MTRLFTASLLLLLLSLMAVHLNTQEKMISLLSVLTAGQAGSPG